MQKPDCQAKGWKLQCMCKPEPLKALELGFRKISQCERSFPGCKESPIKPIRRNVNKVLGLDSEIGSKFGKERYNTEEMVTNALVEKGSKASNREKRVTFSSKEVIPKGSLRAELIKVLHPT